MSKYNETFISEQKHESKSLIAIGVVVKTVVVVEEGNWYMMGNSDFLLSNNCNLKGSFFHSKQACKHF